MKRFEPRLLHVIFCASFILFAVAASKPLQLDNMDFPSVAAATSVTGLPVHYRGEDNPHALGLYHPPLYIYLLAGWIRLFGFGEAQVRLFGLVCALLQGAIVLRIVRTLFGPGVSKSCEVPFWSVFLLSPYTLQTASIADIDSTIYGPLLTAFLWAVLRMSWKDGVFRSDPVSPREFLPAVLLAILCLWAKLTTILLFLPYSFIFFVPRFKIWRAAYLAGAITLAAGISFFLSYMTYGDLTGLDVRYTWEFTLMSFLTRGSGGDHSLTGRLTDFHHNASAMVRFMVAWTGLLPWIAALTAVVIFGIRAVRRKDIAAGHYAALLLLALTTTFYYCGKTPTFGAAPFKYVFVCWGIVLSPLAVLVFSKTGVSPAALSSREGSFKVGTIVALAALTVALTFVGETRLRDDAILNGWHTRLGLLTLPAMLFLFATVAGPWFGVQRRVLVAAFLVYCALQAGTAIYQAKVEYATTYDYGQTGFWDTVAFVRTRTSPDDVIVSMKDIGFKTGRRYYENYLGLYGDLRATEDLMSVIRSGKVKYSVFTEGRGQDQLVVNPVLRDWIARNCHVVASFGNYRIYVYSSDGAQTTLLQEH